MIQFLTSLIEWMAVFAFSTVGIEYTPATGCAPADPAEYQQVALFLAEVEMAESMLRFEVTSSDCGSTSGMVPVQAESVVRHTAGTYDS